MRLVIMVLLCTMLLTCGQVLWKHGLTGMGGFDPVETGIRKSLAGLSTSPFILAGLALYIIATFLWLNILSDAPLSLAYPLMSLSYVLGVVAGWLVFKEPIPLVRWLGVLVICCGVYLVAKR